MHRSPSPLRHALLASLLIVCAVPAARAEDMWALCRHFPAAADDPPPPPEGFTLLNADTAEGTVSERLSLSGNVMVRRGLQRLFADRLDYDARTDRADATGRVRLEQEGFALEGETATLDLRTDRGEWRGARYEYGARHAHGHAVSITREGPDITRLYDATYTTCDPDDVDWELRASRLVLDQSTAVGDAYHLTLRFQDVPFLYFPYLNFPLNDARKTGLLYPTLGHSTESGTDISVPFYWNIAPQYDATLTPRIIERRGLLARGEFRYLARSGGGTLTAEYLPYDKLFNGERGLLRYHHNHTLAPGWSNEAEVNYLSDSRYLRELGNSLNSASTTHVERRMDFRYQGANTAFLARGQGFQTLDPALPGSARPYQRLPQLVLGAAAPENTPGGEYRLRGEAVYFARKDSVTGTRLDAQPGVAWPYETPAYHLTPKVALRYTHYRLDDQTPGTEDGPSRTVPLYSVDSGVFLERELKLGERAFLHTLEPRLYYLKVPFRDQRTLPVFDTGVLDFSFAQLFRDNRYSGADRQGDTEQVSAALTTRLVDADSGAERARAGIGRIFYFEDRRVTLPGEAPDTREASDIIGEASVRLRDTWTSTAELHWDPRTDEVTRGTLRFRYHNGERRLLNLSYRFRRDQLDQADISFLWPLHPRWQVAGRWNYSFLDSRPLETLAGLKYETCCWALHLASRRYVNGPAGDSNSSLFLQLELKGLGGLGQSAEDVLAHDIPGFRGPR